MILDGLGPRIVVMGPSNSGKSTLAAAIGRARGCEALHLDQIRHRPGTDWELRPEPEFTALHDRAILGERWVIDGNYTRQLPQRLARATGFILLDATIVTSLSRYLWRCWFETRRLGALEGAPDHVKWSMIRHIAGPTRANRRRYARLFDDLTIPKIRLASSVEVARFTRKEGLAH